MYRYIYTDSGSRKYAVCKSEVRIEGHWSCYNQGRRNQGAARAAFTVALCLQGHAGAAVCPYELRTGGTIMTSYASF